MKNIFLKYALTSLFAILYLAVGFVSVYHAIYFFGLSNENWLAVILACAFEVGQAAILFYLLISHDSKSWLPWILMVVLTLVQVLGNVYSSYMYMMIHNTDLIKYFTDSVLFYLQDPDPKVNQVMISYITGAILPIVSLCMTSMVVNVSGVEKNEEETVKPVTRTRKRREKVESTDNSSDDSNPISGILSSVEKPDTQLPLNEISLDEPVGVMNDDEEKEQVRF